MQPKWDGFRLLVDIDAQGHVRSWSRRGVRFDDRLGDLLAPFAEAEPGSTFDGELVSITSRNDAPVQDFAAVGRGALHGDREALERLAYVAFDAPTLGGVDLRCERWRERDQQLAAALPAGPRIRLVQ